MRHQIAEAALQIAHVIASRTPEEDVLTLSETFLDASRNEETTDGRLFMQSVSNALWQTAQEQGLTCPSSYEEI